MIGVRLINGAGNTALKGHVYLPDTPNPVPTMLFQEPS